MRPHQLLHEAARHLDALGCEEARDLVAVELAAAVGVRLLERILRQQGAVRSLGQRNSLFVVEYRGRRLLIGSGNNGPRLLSALPDDGPHETSKGKEEDSEIDVVLETNAKGSGASFLSELNHHIGREGV